MAPIKPIHGISADTYKRLATDAGVVYVNYGTPQAEIIGATRGGNGFKIEDDNRQMVADGAPGDIKGDKRRVKTKITLAVNLLEFTTKNLKMLLPGTTSTVDSGTHDKLVRSTQIVVGDYFDNVTLVVAKNATEVPIALKILNAIALNGLDFGAADDDETVVAVEFTAHHDPADLTKDPWEIFNPLEGAITRYTCTYTAGDHGSIIGDGSQIVASGADAEPVYAHPDTGYQFSAWDVAPLSTNPRHDTNVTANITAVATFTTI